MQVEVTKLQVPKFKHDPIRSMNIDQHISIKAEPYVYISEKVAENRLRQDLLAIGEDVTKSLQQIMQNMKEEA